MRKLILCFALAIALSGCGGIVNPYDSSFSCPHFQDGKCVSVETAYKESTGDKGYHDLWSEGGQPRSNQLRRDQTGHINASEEDLYRSALFGRLNGLLNSPTPPMVVAPQVMRVLILPYTGRDNELYMQRYVYMFLGGPGWLLKNAAEGSN